MDGCSSGAGRGHGHPLRPARIQHGCRIGAPLYLSIYLSIPILPSSSLPSVSACCLRAQIFELLDVDADGVINRKDFNAGMVLLG